MARSKYTMKRDANESPIVERLRECGASVIFLNEFDLLVGYKGVTTLMEVKNPDESWSITPKQRIIMNTWLGSPMHIITQPDQAENVLRIIDDRRAANA